MNGPLSIWNCNSVWPWWRALSFLSGSQVNTARSFRVFVRVAEKKVTFCFRWLQFRQTVFVGAQSISPQASSRSLGIVCQLITQPIELPAGFGPSFCPFMCAVRLCLFTCWCVGTFPDMQQSSSSRFTVWFVTTNPPPWPCSLWACSPPVHVHYMRAYTGHARIYSWSAHMSMDEHTVTLILR